MTVVARAPRPPIAVRSWARTISRSGPERWLFVLAGVGWAALVVHAAVASGTFDSGTSHRHVMTGRPMPSMQGSNHGVGGWSLPAVWVVSLAMWVAMLAATMLPLIAANVRYAALRSPRNRRTRVTIVVVAGWFVVWLAAASALGIGTRLLVDQLGLALATVVAFVVAAGWQVTRRKRVGVARCHRMYAPPIGAGMTSACWRFGMRLGTDCVSSCWALMGAMAVSGHPLFVVLPLAWVSWFERRRPHFSPGTGITVAVLVSVAVATSFAVAN